MKELRVLVACGGGIATSTFAATEIAKIAKEHKIPVIISKSPLQTVTIYYPILPFISS